MNVLRIAMGYKKILLGLVVFFGHGTNLNSVVTFAKVNFKNFFREDDFKNLEWNNEASLPFVDFQYLAIARGNFTVRDSGDDVDEQIKKFIQGLTVCHLFARQLKKSVNYEYKDVFEKMDNVICLIVRRLASRINYDSGYDNARLRKISYQDFQAVVKIAFGLDNSHNEAFDKIIRQIDQDAWFSVNDEHRFMFINILETYCYQSSSQKSDSDLEAERQRNFIKPAFGDLSMESDVARRIREILHDLLILINRQRDESLLKHKNNLNNTSFQVMYDSLIKQFPSLDRARESKLLSSPVFKPKASAESPGDQESVRGFSHLFDSEVWSGVDQIIKRLGLPN